MYQRSAETTDLLAQSKATEFLLQLTGDRSALEALDQSQSNWLGRDINDQEMQSFLSSCRRSISQTEEAQVFDAESVYACVLQLELFQKELLFLEHSLCLDSRFLSSTSMFRIPEVFRAVPQIIKDHFPLGTSIHSIGCSNGKECIAIALALEGALGKSATGLYPIHGIDMNETVIQQAISSFVLVTKEDILQAIQAGIPLPLLKQRLFTIDGIDIPHPLAPTLNGMPAVQLSPMDREKKGYLCRESLSAFCGSDSPVASEISDFLARPTNLGQRLTFEAGDALAYMKAIRDRNVPSVIFARNVLYHLCSIDGNDALDQMDSNVPSNAQLLLAGLPKGTLVVLGEIEISREGLGPVLSANGLEQVSSQCPYVFCKR